MLPTITLATIPHTYTDVFISNLHNKRILNCMFRNIILMGIKVERKIEKVLKF